MATLFGQQIEPDFDILKEERNDAGKRVFWVGFILLLAYGLFRNLALEVIQAYVATVVFYSLAFYVNWGTQLRKWWLWKAILASLPMHAVYLCFLFWSDKAYPQTMTKGIAFAPVLILGCATETALANKLIDLFKPRVTPQAG